VERKVKTKMALPSFLLKKIPKQENIHKIRKIIGPRLHTVCEAAQCPNIGECFSRHRLTFMILGNLCTRHCAFCKIEKGPPLPPDEEEPKHIAEAVKLLGLNYAVITSVTRDDLKDGGASHFAKVVQSLPVKVEVLIPDFQGDTAALKTVLDAGPYVLNHNLEIVPRLYSKIRPQADYQRSLNVIKSAKNYRKNIYTKSGFMVGLGESDEEVISVLEDLRRASCDLVTIGQYLPPSRRHLQPESYVSVEKFAAYQKAGKALGFWDVFSGPFVRSSYQAEEMVK
jgi:lipoic acid synthetase